MNEKSLDRVPFSTKIDKNIADKFRAACKEQGIAMGFVLESLMLQFCNGEYYVELKRKDRDNRLN